MAETLDPMRSHTTAVMVKEIFGQMETNINADAAKGMRTVIQFKLSGDGGGDYYVVLRDGACEVHEGIHPSPGMTMTMVAEDFVDMITGKLNGQMAFMSGKLKIAGDMGLSMKMSNLFKRPADGPADVPPVPSGAAGEGASDAQVEPVLLGAAAPAAVRPGDEFTARFIAHVKSARAEVQRMLTDLSAHAAIHLGIQECQWKANTPVTVTLQGQHLQVEEPEQKFEWNGPFKLVDFDVTVAANAPDGTIVLRYDVYVDEIRIAKLRIDLEISRTATAPRLQNAAAEPARSAFASYCSEDRLRVLDRVSAIETSAGIKVFMDCLSLHPGETWKPRLQQEIADRDIFLLFWSKCARGSQWVEWEWKTALAEKGADCFQLQALDMVEDAPPPPELKELHFNDPLMVVRRAYEARRSQ